MPVFSSLFEGLDLLDLWHLYGEIKRPASVRSISASKVSRQSRDLVLEMGFDLPESRGAPDPDLLNSGAMLSLRAAFQLWRLERGCPKVLPTFASSVALQGIEEAFDILPDVYLRAEAIADHLEYRRIDLMLSSSLDLAGELIQQAESDSASPFVVVPLFEDPVSLAVNPAHPLAGMREVAPEDCQAFPSGAYPEGLARLAADALRARGLWRIPARRNRFDASEWLLGMRSSTGLCYETLFLTLLVPESRELVAMPFCEPIAQINCIVMLKEIADHPGIQSAVDRIRQQVFACLAQSRHAFNRC